MSKYNHIASVSIESIPKNELGQAISEWAEGNPFLEKLLWSCYNNGVETMDCHWGAEFTYLGINAVKQREKVTCLLSAIQDMGNITVDLEPDGDIVTPNFGSYNPRITFTLNPNKGQELSIENITEFLYRLDNGVNGQEQVSQEGMALSNVSVLLDFFSDKDSCLMFSFSNQQCNYKFKINDYNFSERGAEISELLSKIGMEYTERCEKIRHHHCKEWSFNASTLEEFNKKISNAVKILTNEWAFPVREKITDDMGYREQVLVQNRKYGKTEQGRKAFEKWFADENQKNMQSLAEMILKSPKTTEDEKRWAKTMVKRSPMKRIIDFIKQNRKPQKSKINQQQKSDLRQHPTNGAGGNIGNH